MTRLHMPPFFCRKCFDVPQAYGDGSDRHSTLAGGMT